MAWVNWIVSVFYIPADIVFVQMADFAEVVWNLRESNLLDA